MSREPASRGALAAASAPALPRAWRRAIAVVAFAALTAASARISVPLPGTPVPLTLQVAAVLLAGFLLGPRAGAASQALYLVAGLSGLPVFAAGGGAAYLLGPTGGYLLAFPAAAAVAGVAAARTTRLPLRALGLAAAVATIHAGGLAWLTVLAGAGAALRTGVLPFLAGDALELLLVLLVGSRLRGRALRLFG